MTPDINELVGKLRQAMTLLETAHSVMGEPAEGSQESEEWFEEAEALLAYGRAQDLLPKAEG